MDEDHIMDDGGEVSLSEFLHTKCFDIFLYLSPEDQLQAKLLNINVEDNFIKKKNQ